MLAGFDVLFLGEAGKEGEGEELGMGEKVNWGFCGRGEE